MALTASKTFAAGEILTASDLNSEFSNIYTNGESMGTPATAAHDMNGFELTLDAAGTSGIVSDTNARIDIKLAGTDLFRFDGTVATPVNGFDFIARATGVDPTITVIGETNTGLDIVAKGAGHIQANGDGPLGLLASQVFGP